MSLIISGEHSVVPQPPQFVVEQTLPPAASQPPMLINDEAQQPPMALPELNANDVAVAASVASGRSQTSQRSRLSRSRGDDDARSVVIRAASTACGDGSVFSTRSAVSQWQANPSNASVINPNPPNHPRSVIMEMDARSTVSAVEAAFQQRMNALRKSALVTKEAAARQRAKEDAAMGGLQDCVWATLLRVPLDALCAHASVPRTVLGWGDLPTGARRMQELKDTMKHLAAFCGRHDSGAQAVVSIHSGALTQVNAAPDLPKFTQSLSVALNQEVGLLRDRLHKHLSTCEVAFTEFVQVCKAAIQRAWQEHVRIRVAFRAMMARIAQQEALKRKELRDASTGATPMDALARLETQSTLSKLPRAGDIPPTRVVSSVALSHELRRRSDRLHSVIQILLRDQLQLAKNKAQLLGTLRLSQQGQVQQTLGRVRAMEEKMAALGAEAEKLNKEREELEAAWHKSDKNSLQLTSDAGTGTTAAQRTVRHLAEAQARMQAERWAVVETVTKALREKLQNETRDAERACFHQLATLMMEARATLRQRVDAARQAEEARVLKLRQELKHVIDELTRHVEVRGGKVAARQMANAAKQMVARHMTNRVQEHLHHIDRLVVELPTFVRQLR